MVVKSGVVFLGVCICVYFYVFSFYVESGFLFEMDSFMDMLVSI